ncbi:MAG: F0F1 ATP synthase subunit epsilon [Pseudomonadota bacterium]
MAFQFDLVSPERRLASFEATEVQIPGADGDMTAMPDHSPVITTLRPGILRAIGAEGTKEFAVTGGFAEVTPAGASVLAEKAVPVSAESRAEIEAVLAEARDTHKEAEGEHKDHAEKIIADIEALLMAMV